MAPPKPTRLLMGRHLEAQMRGYICCDPNFVDNFFTVQKEHWSSMESHLNSIPAPELDNNITAEHSLYAPILNALCSIKNTVDTFQKSHGLDALGTTFCDSHSDIIREGGPDTQLIKPHLVLFEHGDPTLRSWETVMMPIEVKSKHTYRKVGMKQLTRYARAVFAHQIHRRHVYGMVICKWAATFVRFDRSGIVHSEPIDMLHNPEEFRRAFAGLMMLDKRAFGYNTAFTTRITSGGRLDCYIGIPASAFPPDNAGPKAEATAGSGELDGTSSADSSTDSAPESPKYRRLAWRRFKVMERLFHCKGIRSRGTIVLRLREVRERSKQPDPEKFIAHRTRGSFKTSQLEEPELEEALEGPEYALKLMWRDPSKRQEGETLKRLEGEYGLVQCQWHSDILRWDASCHEPGAATCDECHDITPAQGVLKQVNNLGDLDVEVAQEEGSKEPVYVEVDTDGYVGGFCAQRMARIHCWSLFSTVGRPLWTAETPSLFLEAIHDGMLGYWQVFNRGILHRDISGGNVMIAEPGQGYRLRNWEHVQESAVGDSPYDQPAQQTTAAMDHPLADSRKLAQKAIEQLGRDPHGFLGDFDLFTTHGGMEDEFFGPPPSNQNDLDAEGPILGQDGADYKLIDFRTGTPTFMSIRVLKTPVGQPYEHHFMDDLESFFWLILWCVIEHTDPDPGGNGNNARATNEAVATLSVLDRADSDFLTLALSKSGLLMKCHTGNIKDLLAACQNTWANNQALVQVIQRLGDYFLEIDYKQIPLLSFKLETELPYLLNIISEALTAMDPGPASIPQEM